MAQEKEYFLTKKGLDKAKKEQEALKKLKFSKIKNRIFESFDPTDLDPEYFAFQDEMSFLNSKINDLRNILRYAKLIKVPPKAEQDRVALGATILVQVGEQEDEFQIVGTLEANPSLGKISNESPVGKSLLGHRVGDEVVISSPIKTIYKIKKIKY